MNSCESAYSSVLKTDRRGQRRAPGTAQPARLLAVGKTKPAEAIRALAALGQTRVRRELRAGSAAPSRPRSPTSPSNGTRSARCNRTSAARSRGISTGCRRSTAPSWSSRSRATDRADRAPLNVLIQVNIDDEASKSGCAPGDVAGSRGLDRARSRRCACAA